MNFIKGKDFNFRIMVNGQLVALCKATECTIAIVTEDLETTDPYSNNWRSYIPGYNEYTVSVPALMVYSDDFSALDMQQLQANKTIFEWEAGIYSDMGVQYKGTAYINNTSMTSQFRDIVKLDDCTLKGTGPLDIVKAPITKTLYLADFNGVRLPGCPDPYPVTIYWHDGTIIGSASNADDVITQYNEYSIDNGGDYIELIGYTSGCDFQAQIAWNSPLNPDFIPASTGTDRVIGGTGDDDVIGGSGGDNVIGG